MGTIELKNEFHELIDRIKNKAILEKFYFLMDNADKSSEASLLGNLTDEEKRDLFSADDESRVEGNLLPHDEIRKKHNKWL